MNTLLIKKLIKTNNGTYPETTYSNPLLDKNVTDALSRSFVKILSTCKENTNVNNNVRSSILENIRKLCVIHPENHVKVEDSFIELLSKFYEKQIEETKVKESDIIHKKLDTFLVQKHKELDLNSKYTLKINPEIVQSLLNLNANSIDRNKSLQLIYQDVTFWDMDKQFSIIAKDMWTNYKSLDSNILNDLSLKLKPEIENVLLELSIEILNNVDYNWDNVITSNKDYEMLINISCISTNCFQSCSSILNYIFTATYFDDCIQRLINQYINYVKCNCKDDHFSLLYPHHLIPIVSLLDIKIIDLPSPIQKTYVESTLNNLKEVHATSETDLIMLLSHFPNWFDLYFK